MKQKHPPRYAIAREASLARVHARARAPRPDRDPGRCHGCDIARHHHHHRARARGRISICARRVSNTRIHVYTHTHYTYRVVVVALALMETLPKAADCVNALIVKGVVCVSRARVRIARARRRACMGSRRGDSVLVMTRQMRVHRYGHVVDVVPNVRSVPPPARSKTHPGVIHRWIDVDRILRMTGEGRSRVLSVVPNVRSHACMHAWDANPSLEWGRGGGDACATRARVIRRRKRRRRRRGIEGDLT